MRPVTADSGDVADYRAYRASAHPGRRLARAQRYLEAHPRGAWASEVRAEFDADEARFFEAAKASRAKTRDYLVDLPRGPHADAALALLTAFDTSLERLAEARLASHARNTEARLERASAQRRAVGETLLAYLAALLDPAAFGVLLADVPAPLHAALEGGARATWGSLPRSRTVDLFFAIPTRLQIESRAASVVVSVTVEGGRVTGGRIEGPSLFLHWDEADEMIPRDPTDPRDRDAAAAHVKDLLAGAMEARLPAARCDVEFDGALLARACDQWRVEVTPGARGAPDAIVVDGPRGDEGGAVDASAPHRESGRAAPK